MISPSNVLSLVAFRKAKLRRMYDITSAFYDDLHGSEQIRKYEAILRLKALLSSVDGTILDAGCGTGLITERLRDKGRFIVGVDFSEGMLRKAKERLVTRDVDLVLGDVESLPLRPKSFDLILCLTVLQNCDPLKAINSLLHVLKDEGVLILSYFKRSRSAALIEAAFGGQVIRDLDPTDNVLILKRKETNTFKGRARKVAARLYGLSHQGIA